MKKSLTTLWLVATMVCFSLNVFAFSADDHQAWLDANQQAQPQFVDGDVITEVGSVSGKGAREINAEGHAVTPGFMDLHTHLDAQIGWDPMMTSISWHGVTTALMGNCSVCFAPVRPDGHQFLAEMMESVEDIPRQTILEGLPWDWESYGEYLDSIEKNQPGINVAGMVGHSALRYYVMGERGVDENPTKEETQEMAALAAESIRQGAIGFSTNRFRAQFCLLPLYNCHNLG